MPPDQQPFRRRKQSAQKRILLKVLQNHEPRKLRSPQVCGINTVAGKSRKCPPFWARARAARTQKCTARVVAIKTGPRSGTSLCKGQPMLPVLARIPETLSPFNGEPYENPRYVPSLGSSLGFGLGSLTIISLEVCS